MRRLAFLLLFCLVAGTACLFSSPLSSENTGDFPTAAPGETGGWTELARGALHLFFNDIGGRHIYFLRLDAEPAPEMRALDCNLLLSGKVILTPVAVQVHNLTVASAVPAFGVTEDILPVRSFAVAGGRHYYLEEDGLPRELAASPDNNYFALTDRGHNAVWIWNPGKNELEQITSDNTEGFNKQAILQAGKVKEIEGWSLNWAERPCWSPDGRSVYYLSTRTSGSASRGTALWVLDRETGREELACSRKDTSLDILGWAGPKLLLADGDGIVLAYDPSSRQSAPVLRTAHPVSLAPNGSLLLYQKLNRRTAALISPQLFAVNPDGGTEKCLPALPPGYRFNTAGTWSPSGRRFAFLACNTGAPWESILAVITFFPSGQSEINCYRPPAASFDRSLPPAWIDEKRIVSTTNNPDGIPKEPALWLLEIIGEGDVNARN